MSSKQMSDLVLIAIEVVEECGRFNREVIVLMLILCRHLKFLRNLSDQDQLMYLPSPIVTDVYFSNSHSVRCWCSESFIQTYTSFPGILNFLSLFEIT